MKDHSLPRNFPLHSFNWDSVATVQLINTRCPQLLLRRERNARLYDKIPIVSWKKKLNFQRKFKGKSNSYCWVKTEETSRALSFFQFVTEIVPKRKQPSEGRRQMLIVHTLWNWRLYDAHRKSRLFAISASDITQGLSVVLVGSSFSCASVNEGAARVCSTIKAWTSVSRSPMGPNERTKCPLGYIEFTSHKSILTTILF